nr:SDR family oxidoreductase [Sporolactobacillus vineae]
MSLSDNPIIVITGASSGVGKETALLFARSGAITVLLARNRERLKSVAAAIEQRGGRSAASTVDINDAGQVASVFGKIIARFGKIDVLVNCAGFGMFERVDEMDLETVRKMFGVNIVGLIACTKAVLPQMIRQHSGQIVNIASIAGKIATTRSAVYSATKHAVIGFSDGLRLDLKNSGVTVTVVNPGPIRTPFFKTADPDGHYAASVERFMMDPTFVAAKVVRAVRTKKREINLPWYMGACSRLYQLCPRLVEHLGGRWMDLK